MTISKGRFSTYLGVCTIVPWIIAVFFYLIRGVGAITDTPSLLYVFIGVTLLQVVGLVFAVVGIKENTERKYVFGGLILNAPSLLLGIIILANPVLTKQMKYVPDAQEIESKYSEFLVNPVNIEGVEAYKGKGNPLFLFRYKTDTTNFVEQLHRQALQKGWRKLPNVKSAHIFLKETIAQKKNITFFEYDHVKVIHDTTSGTTCVGSAEIVGFEKIPDIDQAPDTKVLDQIFWYKLNSCMSNE